MISAPRGIAPDYDPTDLDAQRERDAVRADRQRAAVATEAEDVVWLLSGPRGRRSVRRQLREAGVLGHIGSSFHSNYGQMCFQEGLRARGLQVLSKILALLASGELPIESYQLLMSETDE